MCTTRCTTRILFNLPTRPPTVQAIGSYGAGIMDVEDLHKIECNSLPNSGACSAMFTACTMATVRESESERERER